MILRQNTSQNAYVHSAKLGNSLIVGRQNNIFINDLPFKLTLKLCYIYLR